MTRASKTTNSTLTQLRYNRTRASNRVRSAIKWCLDSEAPHVDPDGLPSWWLFWSDVIKANTRECVRAARALAMAEGNPILGWAVSDADQAMQDQANHRRPVNHYPGCPATLDPPGRCLCNKDRTGLEFSL